MHYADGGILFSMNNLQVLLLLIQNEFFSTGPEKNKVKIIRPNAYLWYFNINLFENQFFENIFFYS